MNCRAVRFAGPRLKAQNKSSSMRSIHANSTIGIRRTGVSNRWTTTTQRYSCCVCSIVEWAIVQGRFLTGRCPTHKKNSIDIVFTPSYPATQKQTNTYTISASQPPVCMFHACLVCVVLILFARHV